MITFFSYLKRQARDNLVRNTTEEELFMTTTIIGFPRIGEFRDLKFTTEKYFRNEIDEKKLTEEGKLLRKKHWELLKNEGLDTIPSNDFSFYDTFLDTAVLFNIIPKKVQNSSLSTLDRYFALARGHQSEEIDIKALPMKKWFNTNYHYLVPTFEKEQEIKLVGTKIIDDYVEAKELGIETRPTIIGPFTLIQQANFEDGLTKKEILPFLIAAYEDLFKALNTQGVQWLQLDEASLVTDLTSEEIALFNEIYTQLLSKKSNLKVLIQTYFGDVRDIYSDLIKHNFDGIGLDFIEGEKNKELVSTGFPDNITLFAGVVNGKNIWRNHYQKTIELINSLKVKNLVLTTSCSLLHVPFTTENETFEPKIKKHLAFAKEKVHELNELNQILANENPEALNLNNQLFETERFTQNSFIKEQVDSLTKDDFIRQPAFSEREKIQQEVFSLPILPTTTIGSFPQTKEVKQIRSKFNKQEITEKEYVDYLEKRTIDWIRWQEEVGFDVLVHGEFERNDMVEYFGQHLDGYIFSKNGWVQSYGTRGVKPPIIWGDISRNSAITTKWSSFAQENTEKVIKGMLTGPVTILNWSFTREDISLKESTLQLALAIQEEVLDLEKHHIKVIQIDEAALREKLPLRKSDWYSNYLNWAIPAFRLVHSKVQPSTQIHTHMCYSEFTDIITAIDNMDADVISFEASRSNLEILDELKRQNFQTQVGPGVYDIHSPRIPNVLEVEETIRKVLAKVPSQKVWINPDCGLKTRGEFETKASLEVLIEATKRIRKELLDDTK